MSEKRPPSSDTIPIPREVIEKFHRERDPTADGEDVRLSMLEAAAGPELVACPACACLLCGGLRKVSTDTARHWTVRNAPTLPPKQGEG